MSRFDGVPFTHVLCSRSTGRGDEAGRFGTRSRSGRPGFPACGVALSLLLALAGCGWSSPPVPDVGDTPTDEEPASDLEGDGNGELEVPPMPDVGPDEIRETVEDVDVLDAACDPEQPGSACDDANPCTQDECSPAGCTHTPLDGAPCDDADPCTLDDACLAGSCQGATPLCSDGLDCTFDLCAADGECFHPIKSGFCRIGGTCVPDGQEGPLACTVCRTDLSQDSWSDAMDGILCDDQDPCTVGDVCSLGQCSGNGICDDGLWCTKDVCDPESAECSFVPTVGTCLIDSVCWPEGASPADESGQCLVCDPAVSSSSWSLEADGTPCKDYLTCTQASTCQSGVCVPAGSPCDDGNPCTLDECVGATCQHGPFANGTPCDEDGFACTEDSCAAGACEHPIVAGCVVEGQCTGEGQTHPLVPCLACIPSKSLTAWSALVDGSPCDDGLFCTAGDQCAKAQCHGKPLECPGNACAVGKCSEELDQCESIPLGDGLACDDADPCTTADVCSGGDCAGTPKDCSIAAGGSTCLKAWCSPAGSADPGKCLTAPLQAGTTCDDGLACVAGSVCQAGGICGGGKAVTSDECFASVSGSKVCKVGHCMEPLGCLLVNGPDGVSCLVSHGKGICLAGGCKIASCSPGYKDCNKTAEDGCETLLATSPLHCGACGKACTLPSATSSCILGKCTIVACLGGTLDCNGLPDDGCEVNPQTDPAHCGKCFASCMGSNPWQIGSCQKGLCATDSCPSGTLNLDGLPENGCEGMDVLWVDAGATPGLEDGTQEHPFDTIGEALLAVQPGQSVYVQPGTYTEGDLAINTEGTVVAGTGATEVVLVVPAGAEAGFIVHADAVSIRRMTIQGGRYGIEYSGNPLTPIQGGFVEDVMVSGQGGAGLVTGEAPAGIAIRFSDQVRVLRATLSGIAGAVGTSGCVDPAGTGGDAVGILLQWANSTSIENSKILGVVGGAGGQGGAAACTDKSPGSGGRATGILIENSLQTSVVGTSFGGIVGGAGGAVGAAGQATAGAGGIAAGLELKAASLSDIAGNTFSSVTGGAAGKAGTPAKTAGTGGIAIGIGLESSENNWLRHNSFGVVKGGASSLLPGEKEVDASQVGYAIHIGEGAENNVVDPTNHIGVAPIVYLYGVDGQSIIGLNVQTEGWINPTNLGAIVVVASANVLILGNSVSSVRGERGVTSPGAGHPGTGGGPAVGIRVQDCVGCEVSENVVSGILGGAAGFNEPGAPGLPGGTAQAILLEGDQSCAVRDNEVHTVSGGPASAGTPGGTGGAAAAISVAAGLDFLIDVNRIRTLSGGAGGGSGDTGGPGGSAVALLLSGLGEPVSASNNEAWTVDGGAGNPAGESACIRFDASANLSVNHFTCASLGQKAGIGHGFVLAEKGPGTLKLTNSIVAFVSGFGLSNHPANPVPALKSFYCDYWKCKSGEVDHASKDNTLLLDPAFVDVAKGDLRLLSSSGCIDAGDPVNTCVNEPAPNGCRVNIGADGNTPDATSKAGASHCANCPIK